ncbi:hypothetical protein GBF38_008326 [Nibea albiflora]|uniref:Uncharacterized protein n=1 Tax=Nibea albiflora TaxID=240163 RepID=A0ACB7EZ57_NIBAL|nr:hypothetical protein GBF38_008326 [Nibea albiflora]
MRDLSNMCINTESKAEAASSPPTPRDSGKRSAETPEHQMHIQPVSLPVKCFGAPQGPTPAPAPERVRSELRSERRGLC